MHRALVFIAVTACSGAAQPPVAPPTPGPPIDAGLVAQPTPSLPARGAACAAEPGCAVDLLCLPAPGGYCTSFCGVTGTACDGRCVATARAGELCLQACSQDAECRTNEGYVCDPQWKACLLPGLAAIVPKSCPAATPARAAFGTVTQHSTAAMPGIYQLEPSGVVAADGSLVALYISRGKDRASNRLGVLSTGGGPIVDGVFSAADRASYFDPWVARDAKGTLYAVWLAFDTQELNQQIGMAISRDHGATWSPPVSVHEPTDCQDGDRDCLDKPMVVVGPDPKAKGREILYVMYAAGDGLRVRASRDGGTTFGAPTTALAGIYGNATVSADGRLHLVTLNGGPNTGAFGSAQHAVEYTVSSDGGKTFARPIRVHTPGEMLPFFFSNASIAVDTKRKWIYVAYPRGGHDAVWDLVIAASKDGGKTWKRQRIGDDPACAIHMVPNLALDPVKGTLHVAWYDSRGGGRFAHAACTPGATKCTQTGAINAAPFATLSTVRHGAAWIGEYQLLQVDAKRRVLHAAWAQPVDEDGRAISRIFHATMKLPK